MVEGNEWKQTITYGIVHHSFPGCSLSMYYFVFPSVSSSLRLWGGCDYPHLNRDAGAQTGSVKHAMGKNECMKTLGLKQTFSIFPGLKAGATNSPTF